MYYIYGISGPSLLIESTDSMIVIMYNVIVGFPEQILMGYDLG